MSRFVVVNWGGKEKVKKKKVDIYHKIQLINHRRLGKITRASSNNFCTSTTRSPARKMHDINSLHDHHVALGPGSSKPN